MVRPPKKTARQKGRGSSKRMQRMMKNMEEVPATRVLMTLDDGSGILLEGPQVIKLTVQGQETWQIIGTAEDLSPDEMSELLQGEVGTEEAEVIEISEEDIMLVASQTGVSPEEARAALQQSGGEPARAIMLLKSS